MAVGKKQLTSATKKVNPVSTPAAKSTATPAVKKQINNTPTETRPYSSPNYSTPAASSAKSVGTISTNKSTPSSTPSYTAPATPSYSSGTTGTTGSVIAPMAGTAINPAGLLQTQVQNSLEAQAPTVQVPTTPEPTFQNSAQVLLNSQAHPNETPAERTERYLGMLRSVTGASGSASRPYSNPNYSFNTTANNRTGYSHANNNSLEDIVSESVYNSLVGEPGSSAPFTEVPQYNLNNANLAVNGPTAVVANQQANPTLSDLIAAQFARDYGTPVTNNPVNAMISGTELDPYAAIRGTSNTDFSNKSGDINFNTNIRGGGGNGGGGGVGGVPGYESAYDLDALYDLLNRQLAEYNNQYDSLMANLLNAYGMNNEALEAYYQQVLNALGNNYADTEALLNGQLGNSQQALEDDRRRALQEAYIARMMQEKQLADQLDAYGLTGGASESVMANLRNNYMNNRANVEEKTQTSLKDLLQTYLSNLSNARQNYNQSLMNAEQNRLNARQSYANNLAEAQASAANYLANARSGAYENLFNALAKQYLG